MSTDEYDERINEIGTMVADQRGRVGMIVNVYTKTCRIQYGPLGSHATLSKKHLRVATDKEIGDAGLDRREWTAE